ncbi:MAG: hypothetical protein H6737_31805 [Alphaproteobacteria bacterium]|nr:hypothetical protein [Alphaproteobacteria bacterium]
MNDPARGVRFWARGPVEVFPDQGFCHVATHRWSPNRLWRMARELIGLVRAAFGVHPWAGIVVTVLLGPPAIVLYVLGAPLWVWHRRRHRVVADRSGITFRGRRWNWEEVDGVQADNVEWRESTPPAIAHAVVLDEGKLRWAMLVPTFERADALAEQLVFLHRTARGTPEDVPDALRAAQAAAERA